MENIKKADAILAQPENCEDDSLGDMYNLCCEMDKQLRSAAAENAELKAVLGGLLSLTRRLNDNGAPYAGLGGWQSKELKTTIARADELLRALGTDQAVAEVCEWRFDDAAYMDTACGHKSAIPNSIIKFCSYCGLKIKECE